MPSLTTLDSQARVGNQFLRSSKTRSATFWRTSDMRQTSKQPRFSKQQALVDPAQTSAIMRLNEQQLLTMTELKTFNTSRQVHLKMSKNQTEHLERETAKRNLSQTKTILSGNQKRIISSKFIADRSLGSPRMGMDVPQLKDMKTMKAWELMKNNRANFSEYLRDHVAKYSLPDDSIQ